MLGFFTEEFVAPVIQWPRPFWACVPWYFGTIFSYCISLNFAPGIFVFPRLTPWLLDAVCFCICLSQFNYTLLLAKIQFTLYSIRLWLCWESIGTIDCVCMKNFWRKTHLFLLILPPLVFWWQWIHNGPLPPLQNQHQLLHKPRHRCETKICNYNLLNQYNHNPCAPIY